MSNLRETIFKMYLPRYVYIKNFKHARLWLARSSFHHIMLLLFTTIRNYVNNSHSISLIKTYIHWSVTIVLYAIFCWTRVYIKEVCLCKIFLLPRSNYFFLFVLLSAWPVSSRFRVENGYARNKQKLEGIESKERQKNVKFRPDERLTNSQ